MNTVTEADTKTPRPSSLVIVRRSPIQGRGVFARAPIAKGVRIIEYAGERQASSEIDEDVDDEASRRHHTFLFSVNAKTVIDGLRGGNESRFINHSCDPNCWAVVERGRVFIEAKRPIAVGEELAYDYWYTTDSSYTNAELRRIYPCHCGAKRCRGTLAAPRRKSRAKTAKKAARAKRGAR
jgi:SET domain-containing protein